MGCHFSARRLLYVACACLLAASGCASVHGRAGQVSGVAPSAQSSGITRAEGAFELGKEIPLKLATPAIKDFFGYMSSPFTLTSIRFDEEGGRLVAGIAGEGSTIADGRFAVRVFLFDGARRPKAVGKGEAVVVTDAYIALIPAQLWVNEKIDLADATVAKKAKKFVVEIEDVRTPAEKDGLP